MTTHVGPLHIKRLDSDVTAVAIEAGGSATFTDAVRANSDIIVSGQVQSGPTGQVGVMMLTQSATVLESMTAATQLMSLPNAIVHDILYKRVNAGGFSTAAATVDILIGTSGDDDAFGRFGNVSANAALSFTEDGTNVCGLALHNYTTQGLFVKVTAVSGVVSGALGVGHITTIYTPR